MLYLCFSCSLLVAAFNLTVVSCTHHKMSQTLCRTTMGTWRAPVLPHGGATLSPLCDPSAVAACRCYHGYMQTLSHHRSSCASIFHEPSWLPGIFVSMATLQSDATNPRSSPWVPWRRTNPGRGAAPQTGVLTDDWLTSPAGHGAS